MQVQLHQFLEHQLLTQAAAAVALKVLGILALVVLVLHTLQQTTAAVVVVVVLLAQEELAAAARAVVQVLRLVFLAQQIPAVAVVVLHRHHLRVIAQVESAVLELS